MCRRVGVATVLSGALLSRALPLPAQGGTPVDLVKVVQFAVPATPALSFLGSTSEKITRPTTAKDAITQIVNAVDENGKVVQGLAFELAPRSLFWPNMDLKSYQSRGGYIVAHTAFSVGSTKVSGDTGATNLGVGVRVTLVDKSDPMTATPDILASVHKCSGDHPRPSSGTALTAWQKCWSAEDSAFRVDFAARHWNDVAVTVSWATGQQLSQSDFSSRHAIGFATNALVALPLALGDWLRKHGQVLAQVGYESRDSIEGAVHPTTATTYGARLTLGSAAIGAFAEVLGSHRRGLAGASVPSIDQADWSAGVEFKVSDDLWATTGFGSRYNAIAAKNKAIVLAGIKVNLSGKRSFAGVVPN